MYQHGARRGADDSRSRGRPHRMPCMAWVKIPAEHHPIFLAALPRDPRVSTVQMFGGIAAKVNGHMLGGLFARSAMVRLSPADRQAALALDGAVPFDPMGRGAVMKDTVLLPDAVMDDPAALRRWLARAIAYTATLPPKAGTARAARPKPAKPAARPARPATPARAKPAARPARKASAPRKAAAGARRARSA
ncbi:MAG: TfoX/Sxy family protein [Deltaproteobacteria bacterium]|nr:MAG: TfoX/Sxy family protein [Deltaproteobacteria bacterium]